MADSSKAGQFLALHVPGTPLVLYNIWDAGSARVVVEAGAKALATGSWSVAVAQGYTDGETVPLDLVEAIARRVIGAVNVPVSIDFEGAYSTDPAEAAANAARLMAAGAVGINFEDQVVGGSGLHDIAAQCRRIAAIRARAEELRIGFFINARTDLFLQAKGPQDHAALLGQAKTRAKAYHDAGASGFFAPLLSDEALIADLCAVSPLPVNVLARVGMPATPRLAELGVARISHGPGPHRALMAQLKDAAARAMAG